MKPSNFKALPMGSTMQKSEAETIARNIMCILSRTCDTFRPLTWEEYKEEREKDEDFSEGERSYFDVVIDYCKSPDTARLFSPVWEQAYLKAEPIPTPVSNEGGKQPEKTELPESINCSEFQGSGLFYLRNDRFRLDGLDIAEMTTNNPVEFQKQMGEELAKRYNEYPNLLEENNLLKRQVGQLREALEQGRDFIVDNINSLPNSHDIRLKMLKALNNTNPSK